MMSFNQEKLTGLKMDVLQSLLLIYGDIWHTTLAAWICLSGKPQWFGD